MFRIEKIDIITNNSRNSFIKRVGSIYFPEERTKQLSEIINRSMHRFDIKYKQRKRKTIKLTCPEYASVDCIED
jgi:hypothetical protein